MVRPILKRLDLEGERKIQNAIGELGMRVMSNKVDFSNVKFENFSASWARPESPIDDYIILYLHGGSYTSGDLEYAQAFGGVLADLTGANTLCVGYRLAPEYPYPAAIEDILVSYKYLLKRFNHNRIALVGESAGGGLCFSFALRLKEEGMPLPGCIVSMSPWSDLRCVNKSYEEKRDVDPCLFEESLRESAKMYSSGDYENPMISPILGDLTGLPPTFIIVGTDEILLDDSLQMGIKLKESGVDTEMLVAKEMWHVYCIYGMPEAMEAQEKIKDFIDRKIKQD
ncbi:MAG: alpha/beta hydrolase [Ruminococcaceae bacterium]|nr:alpha/beta hydrolase [Oscillospiraceae bacterium]